MKKTATTKTINIKRETVKDLGEKIQKAKSVAFVDYHGLAVNQIAQLRAKIKEVGGELVVVKNTLAKRALTDSSLTRPAKPWQSGVTHNSSLLTGPTAIVFSYQDEIEPSKTIAQSNQNLGSPKFKFGFLGQNFIDAMALEDLAKIPSHRDLQGKIVSTLASPIYGVINVLQANLRNLVSVLDQATNKSQVKVESQSV